MEQAEREIRALIDKVDNSREGWVCIDCDPDDPQGEVTHLIRHEGGADPVCEWHKDERIHDAITYGNNCSRCGIDHSPLWPGQWPDPR